MNTETVVTNAETGGRKARKLARFDLLPPDALRQVAEHYGRGAEKYEDRNWELGYDWSLSFGAMQRHLWSWWAGEDDDPETATSHLAAAAFHCFALLTFIETHPELDDRPSGIDADEVDEVGRFLQEMAGRATAHPRVSAQDVNGDGTSTVKPWRTAAEVYAERMMAAPNQMGSRCPDIEGRDIGGGW